MAHDPARVETAEEFLEDLREMLIHKIEAGELLKRLYPRASEQQQILMMGPMDEAHEAERLLAAFAVARTHLARKAQPARENPPPRSNRRGPPQ